MARDYGKRNSSRNKGSVSKQLVLLLVAFLSGYLSASVFDLTSLSSWVNTQLLAKQAGVSVKPVIQQAQLPKPKFEFYTLLANERAASAPASNIAPVSHAVPTTQTNNPPQTPANAVISPGQQGGIATNKTPSLPLPLSTVVSAGKKASLVAINKEAYLVQVGSFRRRHEAERMKASLSLKGFVVNIKAITQQQTNWYRVVLGPFPSRDQAYKAQVAVARSEHLVGMIRKMEA